MFGSMAFSSAIRFSVRSQSARTLLRLKQRLLDANHRAFCTFFSMACVSVAISEGDSTTEKPNKGTGADASVGLVDGGRLFMARLSLGVPHSRERLG